MNTKIPFILIFFAITGCQGKSEIDKCVEAKVISECTKGTNGINISPLCKETIQNAAGGIFRESCLKAQANKD